MLYLPFGSLNGKRTPMAVKLLLEFAKDIYYAEWPAFLISEVHVTSQNLHDMERFFAVPDAKYPLFQTPILLLCKAHSLMKSISSPIAFCF
jgi:hypothetical protein